MNNNLLNNRTNFVCNFNYFINNRLYHILNDWIKHFLFNKFHALLNFLFDYGLAFFTNQLGIHQQKDRYATEKENLHEGCGGQHGEKTKNSNKYPKEAKRVTLCFLLYEGYCN